MSLSASVISSEAKYNFNTIILDCDCGGPQCTREYRRIRDNRRNRLMQSENNINYIHVECDCCRCYQEHSAKRRRVSAGNFGIAKYFFKYDDEIAQDQVDLQQPSTSSAPSTPSRDIGSKESILTNAKNVYKLLKKNNFICHTIVRLCSVKDTLSFVSETIRQAHNKNNKTSILLFSIHYAADKDKDHLHILHDCSRSSCRCQPFQFVGHIKNRRSYLVQEMPMDLFTNLVVYLRERPLFCFYYKGHRQVQRRLEMSHEIECREISGNITNDTGECPDGINCFQENKAPVSKRTPVKVPITADELLLSIKKFLVSPLELVNRTKLWLNEPDKVTSVLPSSKLFKQTMTTYEEFFSELRYSEILAIHRSENIIKLYSCTGDNFLDEYFNEEVSTLLLEKFILHQANSNRITIYNFLKILYKFLRKLGSKNCLLFYGNSNTGKTWFATILMELMINYAWIGVLGSDKFPFSCCVSRNILIYDSPNVPEKSYEILKKLFGGTPITVKTGSEEKVINRTPVVVCASKEVYPNATFHSVIHKFTFIKFDFEQYTKKIQPLSIANLFEKYKIY